MSTITMTYGSYNFTPVPFLRITKEHGKTSDGTRIGTIYHTTLNGNLVNLNPGGLQSIMSGQDVLKSGLANDGQLFLVQCNGGTVLSAYPRVNSINFDTSSDNWVYTCPYSIELEFDDEIAPPSSLSDVSYQPPYIQSTSEDWEIEMAEDSHYYSWSLADASTDKPPYQFRVTHNIGAVGKRHYGASGLVKEAWQQARDYVVPKLGFDYTIFSSSGVFNVPTGGYQPYNHVRKQTLNETDGSFNVTESWLAVNTGNSLLAHNTKMATESFTVTEKVSKDTSIDTVNIEGTIQGLDTINWGTSPSSGFSYVNNNRTKDSNAYSYYAALDANNRFYYRCLFSMYNSLYTLNSSPLVVSVGRNPSAGTITYNYEYNTRPSNCIAGALSENISVNDNNPTDLFATLTVLGRTNGPILQSLGTVTAATREVSIDCVMAPYTGCPTNAAGASGLMAASPKTSVATLLCGFQADLQARAGYVFKNADSEKWEPKTGRYSRQVTWTYQICSGTAPTLC